MRRTTLVGKGFQAIAVAVVVLLLGAGIAFADPATGQSISINAADDYTNSTSVSVNVAALHCPPGGDMTALEVAFRNSASAAWTVVKAGGANWPGSDTDGCNAGVSTPASFNWTLASGVDGSRTVFARFKHGTDEVFAQDSITLDTTAPAINDDGLTATSPSANAAGWYKAAVTNKFSASDGGSGLADCTSPWEVSSGTSEGSNVLIPSGPCSDVAGNTNNGINAGPFKIDMTAPAINDDGLTATSPSANAAGWYKAAVTNKFSASDGGSGLADCTSPWEVSSGTSEGSNVLIPSGPCSDVAGNTNNGINAGPFKIDLTNPTINDDGLTATSPSANAAGWYKAAVTNKFSASDGGSGLADCTSPWEVSSGTSEGSNVLIPSGPCSDNAGNTNNGINAGPFKIDLTNPLVSITSPANNSSTSDSSVTVSGTASDNPSGLKSVTVNGSAVTVSNGQFSTSVALSCGANQITAVATDNADRTAQDQISVTRNCNVYTLRYLSPIDGSTVGNIVTNLGKNGRVIPVKVEVSLNGTELSDADLAAGDLTIGVNKMASCAASASDAVEAYADAGSSSAGTNAFRWSADAPGFWIYNLDTKALGMVTNTCYRLDVYLNGNKISESQFGVFKPVK